MDRRTMLKRSKSKVRVGSCMVWDLVTCPIYRHFLVERKFHADSNIYMRVLYCIDVKAEIRLTMQRKNSYHADPQNQGQLSVDVGETDDVKAATTASTITEEKRIVCEDVIWDQINLRELIPWNSLTAFMSSECPSLVENFAWL